MYQQWFLWAFLVLKMEYKFKGTVHLPPRDSAVKHHSRGLHADKTLEIEKQQ
jgi:hypothetical protein